MLEYILLVVVLLFALYIYGTWTFDRFKGTIVPYVKPVVLVGNSLKLALRMENVIESIGRSYDAFPQSRFVGVFQMRLFSVLLRDPELIRQVGVKDFDSFTNHRPFFDVDVEPLFGSSLFALQDQKWRDMRATLSPAFTGSKMRLMFEFIVECAEQITHYLHQEVNKKGALDLEVKDLVTKYANDVIATSAFGIKVDSLKDPENIFYKMGKRVTNFSGVLVSLKFFAFMMMPRVMKFFRVSLLDRTCGQFFRTLVHDTMETREEQGIVRPDMIHLLMQAKKGALQHDAAGDVAHDAGFATVTESAITKTHTPRRVWSNDEITGQALLFFLAGFETISTASSFTAYELAINPDVQKTLQEEIDTVCQELKQSNHKNVDYERLHKMKYLDMVVSEGLRKWPAAPFTDRVCNNRYLLEDHNRNKYEVKKGETLFISIYHIHHDEKYYDNPDKFDPNRFSEENKHNIKPFTYMPFGVGPRNCIGSRFALMEMKAFFFNILKEFDIVPSEKTQIPLKLAKSAVQMKPENGFWIKLQPRKIN
ncbi:cytochrome P450 9e2-like [Ctenocephalides felis]|uniref:cytochrome P450 9e2-like n=1 Tax=Ctenocephalides felis TaxID=7515 RepID=UPI000E6E16D3|nr:cytochrome P450 9e2-like [Ctenocephalides felis]